MASDRYVLLGLAHVRSAWFRDASRWSTAASLPIELVKNMSVEEVRVRLRSGRAFSALVVDDLVPGLDRDLISLATEVGCSVIVVDSGRAPGRWRDLGASATVPPDLDPQVLLQVLGQVARPVDQSVMHATAPAVDAPQGFRGHLVAVTGAGGTGRSTLAIGLAQCLADDPGSAGLVCLADLALDAEQAMLHGSPDVVPGLLELVDAHRLGDPTTEAIQGLTWQIEARGYDLLLGLRRHRDWTALRPRAVAAALDGLRRSYRCVVADVDADLEGERSTGSADVEERNVLARTAVSSADVVVIVGGPGMKGLHGLVRTTRDVLAHGVPTSRILPVVNRAPKGPRARAELTRAFAQLAVADATSSRSSPIPALPSPVFVAERRHVDLLLRDGARLPDGWIRSLATSVAALVARAPRPLPSTAAEPVRVTPGSLGSWTDDDPVPAEEAG